MKKFLIFTILFLTVGYLSAQTKLTTINYLSPTSSNNTHFAHFSPDGKTILSGGKDGNIYIWNLTSDKFISSKNLEAEVIWEAVYTPDGKYILAGGYSGILYLCDASSLTPIKKLGGFNQIHKIAVSKDSKQAFISTGSKNKLVDLVTFTMKINEVGYAERSGWFSKDGSSIFHAPLAYEINEFGSSNGSIRRTFKMPANITDIAVTADNKYMVAGLLEHQSIKYILYTVNLETGEIKGLIEKKEAGDYAIPFDFLPGTHTLIYNTFESGLHLVDLDTGKITKLSSSDNVARLSSSNSGKFVVSHEKYGRSFRLSRLD